MLVMALAVFAVALGLSNQTAVVNAKGASLGGIDGFFLTFGPGADTREAIKALFHFQNRHGDEVRDVPLFS
jgi:hypothetical protein